MDVLEGELRRTRAWLADRRGDFGRYRKDVTRLGEVRELLRASGESVRDWIKRTRSGLALALERKGGHLGEALDWLGGTVPVPTAIIHPALTSVVADYIACSVRKIKPKNGLLQCYFSLLAPGAEAEVANMPLAQRVYSW